MRPDFKQPIIFFGHSSEPMNVGKIDYDALEAALVKRFASDYSFRVSYTLGYSRGNTSGAFIPVSGFQVLDISSCKSFSCKGCGIYMWCTI